MKKTNLFIVGAPKCGTTAWVEYLNTHPKIGFSSKKEPHYFSDDFSNFRWAKNITEYESMFTGIDPSVQYVAEASTMYLYSEHAARNIHAYNSDAKILVFLRKPEHFLVSYHQQLLNIYEEDIEDFEEAWCLQDQRLSGDSIPKSCREPAFLQYKSVAKFGEQLKRYLTLFGRNNVKVIIFEEWIKHPRATYIDILGFLGVADNDKQAFPVIHESRSIKYRTLGKLLHHPPQIVMTLLNIAKKVLGKERLNLSSKLRNMNVSNINKQQLSVKIKSNLNEEFYRDMQQIENILNRKIEVWG